MAKILVVDDQRFTRFFLKGALSSHEVIEASNGFQAEDLANEEQPDLVLMDVGMPIGPNGDVVAGRLRDNPETAHIPIVLMSGDPESKQRAKELGLPFLDKPFKLQKLLQLVEELLNS